MTTTALAASEVNTFDYLVVGGGTAGCVVASRLAEYLPDRKILLIEAGPSDFMDDRVLKLENWLTLLGGELDYDYGTTEQPNGNAALDIPVVDDFNKEIRAKGQLEEAVGFFSVSYNPEDGRRSSASVAYIHPILRGEEERPNLTVLTNAWVSRVNVNRSTVTGVNLTLQSGTDLTLNAKQETILCAGAVDSPRLLLHSGIGPQKQLKDLGIPAVHDVPGIGYNLLDHPETIIIWELNRPVPKNQTTMDSDAGIFLRRESVSATDRAADLMMHCYQIPFCLNTARLGYDTPTDAFCLTPNIPRPRSKGRLYLTSKDPNIKPALDFKYFTDPEGYDAATIVAGFKVARKVAQEEPFKSWIKREVAPGPGITSDEGLSEYGRKVAHTVYHPAGTTKMGNINNDEMAVVDPELRLRGLKGIRIADAGVFPEMPSINPMLTVLAIGERAAELIAQGLNGRREEGEKAKL